MFRNKTKKYLAIFVCSLYPMLTHSWSFNPFQVKTDNFLYDEHPFALTYYYGITASDALIRFVQGKFHRWPEHVQSLELAYTLDQNNVVRRFFSPIVSVVQIAANTTYRAGKNENDIFEFDPYIAFRFVNFPWNNYVNTSIAIGEGISYASSIPALEIRSNEHTKRLLNYLMLESSFALPKYPRLQLVARIHHRSGAFGLYRAGNTGSNAVGLGIRYLID